jgi:methionyl-tRNA formyltransferase
MMLPIPQPLNNSPVKIILCGYGPLCLALLKGLLKEQDQGVCQIVGVFRWSDALRQNSCKLPEFFLESAEAEIAKLCLKHQLRRLQGKGLNSYGFTRELLHLKADIVLIGSWGEKLKAHLLNDTKALFINCHPSLLPAHRGPNPYASVILNEETETGVTFHKMSETIDAGPIILQRRLTVYSDDDGSRIRERCSEVAESLVPELLALVSPTCLEGKPLEAEAQDEATASYFPALSANDASINWALSADELSRLLRARFPWAMAYTSLFADKIRLYLGPAEVLKDSSKTKRYRPGSLTRINKAGLYLSTQAPSEQLLVKSYAVSIASLKLSQRLSSFLLRALKLFS